MKSEILEELLAMGKRMEERLTALEENTRRMEQQLLSQTAGICDRDRESLLILVSDDPLEKIQGREKRNRLKAGRAQA